ncbi:putative bifunctional diguanylate cyclase/phosphodiesterase [Roseibium sp.]|uniref:putative bifunctional diguanylate cyclase/phosphodiesterase n=1 Tax=Roseibium sp. TaxID=1936156 RepID=UPI003A983659
MKIHRWLIAIVVLLMAPILLFATLWIRNTLDAVHADDRGLTGLHLLVQMEPHIRRAARPESRNEEFSELDPENALGLSPELHTKFLEDFKTLSTTNDVGAAARSARSMARTIVAAVDLPAIVDVNSAELAYLISDTLLSVVVEASAMVQTGNRIAMKGELNLWDKMAVTVQGGQFKVSADAVARVSNTYFPMLMSAEAAPLIAQGKAYREANGAYQTQGAALLTSTLKATRGDEVDYVPVSSAFPVLVQASLDLWRGTINYLAHDLKALRQANLVAVATASATGLLITLIALGMAIVVSRSLAVRTLQKFAQLGYHDPLTALPNRRALVKALKDMPVTRSRRRGGLLLLDIRRFKAINSRYGDQFGDQTLRVVARHLEQLAGEGDVVARTGGTEFILLRPRLRDQQELKDSAEKILRELGEEKTVYDQTVRLDACIGMSMTAPGENPSDQLLTDAALALRHAKRSGNNCISLFEPEMRSAFDQQTEMSKELQEALSQGKIVPWFQPQVCIKTGEIIGAEALVRWIDTPDGVRFPGAFLGAAAEAGLMEPLDAAVRKKALAMTSHAIAAGQDTFHIGLNVSASMLMADDCVDRLMFEVEAAQIRPEQVSIEILEAVMIDEIASAPIMANVARLSELGFFIELDDFGTGHSSISSLRDLKVDRVKIDRSFVSGVDHNEELQQFTGTLIQLAKGLSISVLAEGVETEGERDWLADNGCDVIQGYLISKAVPEEDILAQLAHHCASKSALLA